MARSGVDCAAPLDRQEPEASVLAGVPRSVLFASINVATTGTSSVAGCGFRKFWHTLTQALQSAPARPSRPRRASRPECPKSRSTAFYGSSSGRDQDDSPTAATRLDSGTTPLRAPLIGPLSADQRPPGQIPAENGACKGVAPQSSLGRCRWRVVAGTTARASAEGCRPRLGTLWAAGSSGAWRAVRGRMQRRSSLSRSCPLPSASAGAATRRQRRPVRCSQAVA